MTEFAPRGPRHQESSLDRESTVELAGMPVARIGFGVMQLERSALDKDAALAILRQAATPASTTSTRHGFTAPATS